MARVIESWRMTAIRVLTNPASTEDQRAHARRFLAQHGGL